MDVGGNRATRVLSQVGHTDRKRGCGLDTPCGCRITPHAHEGNLFLLYVSISIVCVCVCVSKGEGDNNVCPCLTTICTFGIFAYPVSFNASLNRELSVIQYLH